MASSSITFKDWRDSGDFDKLHEKLILVLEYLLMKADEWDVELVVTSVWRPDGVHNLYRATDIVPRNRNTKIMNILRDEVNEALDYGKEPYEVIPPIDHNPDSEPHLHTQARDETNFRGV